MIINPVLAKELRDRVRTWRSPLVVTLYLGVIALIGGFFLYERTMFGYGGPRVYRMGIEIFNLMAILQIALVAFLTPGITASVISGERERQTLNLLLITRISPAGVAVGKLLSAISYIVLLTVIALPLYSIVFFFGGVSMLEFIQAAGILLATTVTLGSIGLFCSALFKRTTVAILVTYGITFLLFIGTLFGAQIIMSLMRQLYYTGGNPPVPFILYFNPAVALGSILPMGGNFLPFGSGNFPIQALTPWQVHLLLDAGIILLTMGLAVWLIRPQRAGTGRRG